MTNDAPPFRSGLAWGLNKNDKPNVYRVELRAAKNELKQKWGITTFADFEAGIGDVYTHAAKKVRYLADCQTDSNISKHK